MWLLVVCCWLFVVWFVAVAVVEVVVVVVRTCSMTCLCRYAPAHASSSGGRSPGSQTRGEPAPEPSTTKNSSSSRAPQNSSAQCPDGEQVTARNKGLMKIISRLRQIQQPKHRLCDFSILRPAKSKGTQGEVHRNQQNQ